MQTYNTRPLLDIRPNFDTVDQGQLDDFVLDTQGVGAHTPWKPTTGPKRHLRLPFLFTTRSAWRTFRDFFAARKWMLEGFWIPTYLGDLRLTQDVAPGSSTLVIDKVGLATAFAAWPQYGHVALVDVNTIRAFQIQSVAAGGSTETITLTQPVTAGATAALTVCCPLLYGRLSEDFDYECLTDEVVKTELKVVELPQEYVVQSGGGYAGTALLGTKPVYVYQIKQGATTWLFADWGQSLAINGQWWASENLGRSQIRSGTEFLAENFDIDSMVDQTTHPFYTLLDRLNPTITEVTIFLTDADTLALDPAVPFYIGRVGNATDEGMGLIKVKMGSALRLSERQVPGPQVQRTCVHRLYDANCAVDINAFTTAGTITALTDAYVDAIEFGNKVTATGDPNWFALGRITVGAETRLCTGTDGANRLYLNYPFRNALVGQSISATAGCNKRVSTCNGKFNNLLRTIQFPYIPNRNPQFESLAIPKTGGGKKS